MDEQEEELQKELQKAREFFSKQKKNDRCFYKLYDVRYADSTYDRNDLRATNYDTQSMPESMKRLEEDLRSLGERSKAVWVLKHYTAKNDPQPITLILKNVYYNPENHKTTSSGSNINGFGGQGVNGINGIIGLVQDHHRKTNELETRFLEYKHQQEMKELEARIEELEYAKRGKLDAINEFIATPVGTQLAAGLLAFLQVKLFGNDQPPIQQPIQQQTSQVNQPPKEKPQQKQDNSSNQDQQQQIIKVNNALSRLHKVFGGDAINALEDVAIFCEKNPQLAHQLLHQQKAKQTQPPTPNQNQNQNLTDEGANDDDDDGDEFSTEFDD